MQKISAQLARKGNDMKLKVCPKCHKKCLETRQEALKAYQPESIGDCFNISYIKVQDEWSIMSKRCMNCGYIK
jgi:hypothetical protein